MERHQRRRERSVRASSSGPVVLTDRDFDLLALIGLCRFVSTEQVARTFFPSADRARRRVRQLFDAGYLALTLQSSTAPSLLSLTKLAVTTIADRDPELAGSLRLAGSIRLTGAPHHLGVVDTRLYLVAVLELLGLSLVRWDGPQGTLGRAHGLPSLHLEPDGLADIAGAHAVRCLAIEFDAGTETLTVLRTKFERYSAAQAARQLDGLCIVAAGGARRVQAIADLIDAAGLSSWSALLGASEVRARPVRVPQALARLLPEPKSDCRFSEKTEVTSRGCNTEDRPWKASS